MGFNEAIQVIQVAAGALLAMLVPAVGYVVKEVITQKSRLSALESRVNAENEETLRRFDGLDKWMQKIDQKLDRISEKQT